MCQQDGETFLNNRRSPQGKFWRTYAYYKQMTDMEKHIFIDRNFKADGTHKLFAYSFL